MAFKTRQQLADEFGISPRTLSRWIKKENLPVRRGLISPKEQLLIYESLGYFKMSYKAVGPFGKKEPTINIPVIRKV